MMKMKVIKKLGYRQEFDINKIKIALQKAGENVGVTFTASNWKELKPRIESRLEPIMKDREEIYFWEIDECVIDALLRSRFNEITKQYIKTRAEVIEDKLNDLGLSPHAMTIVKERYLRKDDEGNPIETVKEMLCRVASSVASVEPNGLKEKYTKLYSDMLLNRDFLPNSPCLVSAGTKHKGTLAACLTEDTIIHTVGGDKTIEELYTNEIENFFVYSCDGINIKIGIADKVVKTRSNADVYKIIFDNGASIKTTENHLIMMRDGTYKSTSDLQIGESIMPFNICYGGRNDNYLEIFEKISTNKIPAHRFVFRELNGYIPNKGRVIHHKDFNPKNNNPNNLIDMDAREHWKLHSKYNPMKTEEMKKHFSELMKGNQIAKGIKRSQKFKDNMSENNPMYNEESREKLKNTKIKQALKNGSRVVKICPICGKEFESQKHKNRKYCSLKCVYIANKGNKHWLKRKAHNPFYNHKITSIEYVGKEDVYDVRCVDGFHNFAANGIFVHNCFAYSIEDSLDDILDVVKKTAKTFQLGGGVGISIAKLREQGSKIHTTNGVSSGSVEFLNLFDTMCTTIKTGGFRRGALMCLTEYNHPDIEWFIHCKRDVNKLNNMNISVLVDDKFFNALDNNDAIPLVSPKTKEAIDSIPANLLLEQIATNIWETGEPGILYYNAMNKANPTPHLGDIRLTNPCSESNLLNNEACVLGSINLVNHMTEDCKDMDWDRLAETTKLSTRFLDDMVDASPYPTKDVEDMVKATRKIGVGIMGFADVLILMGIKYSSKNAITMAGKIMSFINDVADQESKKLGEEKGLYKEYKKGYRKRRNAVTTVLAPTGCSEETSLIFTDDGLLTLNELNPNEDDEYCNFSNKKQWKEINIKVPTLHGLQKSTQFYCNGLSKTKIITGSYGTKYQSTYNHKYRVYNYDDDEIIWKRVDELRIGDKLVKRLNQYNSNGYQELSFNKPYDRFKKSNNISVPKLLDEDLAKLIGYYIADGVVLNNNTVEFCTSTLEPECAEFILKVVKNKFNIEGKVYKRENNQYRIKFNSKQLNKFFVDNDFNKNGTENVYIPILIRKSPRSVIWAFLSGLYSGDGCIRNDDGRITYKTISWQLVKQLQTLLLGLGIQTNISVNEGGKKVYFDNGKRFSISKKSYNLQQINKYYNKKLCENISFIQTNKRNKQKQVLEEPIKSNQGDYIPIHSSDNLCRKAKNIYNEKNRLGKEIYIPRCLVMNHKNNIFISNNLALEEIVDIENVEENIETYDISVPISNTYILNGALSHNTLSLLAGVSPGVEPNFYREYTRPVDNKIITVTHPLKDDECFEECTEITPEQHLAILAEFQKHTENSVSKCIAEGTLIQTNKGIYPIEQLIDEQTLDIDYDEFHKPIDENLKVITKDGYVTKVNSIYYGGYKNTKKVRFDNGYVLEGTLNHRVMTNNGWKRLDELVVGDYTKCRIRRYSGRSGNELPSPIEYKTNNPTYNNITIPTHMSNNLAEFLGMIISDGCLIESTGKVGLTTNNDDVANRFDDLTSKLFNVVSNSTPDKRSNTNTRTLYITSRKLCRWIKSLIGNTCRDKYIPDEIMQGSVEERIACLNGITLDGYIKNRGVRNELCIYDGYSEKLANQIFSICCSLGYKPYLSKKLVYDNQYTYGVIITEGDIIPLEKHKQVELTKKTQIVDIPSKVFDIDKSEYKCDSTPYNQIKYIQSKNLNITKSNTLDDLRIGYDDFEYYIRVTDIQDSENRVYDLSVDDESHSYLVNNIISHNTINVPENTTVEDIKLLIIKAHDMGVKGITILRDRSNREPLIKSNCPDCQV